MSDYKKYFLTQFGIKEALKPSNIQPSEVDPNELEMGVDDEKAHTDDPGEQQTIALQHLKDTPDYYSRIKAAGVDGNGGSLSMMSPTAISTPVIAMAVRGSSTGGLPSGADRGMSLSNTDGVDISHLKPSQLGGYEPIITTRDNSRLVNKTPKNSEINSNSIKVYNPQVNIDVHPHQVQQAQGEPPQEVTGASTEDSPLMLKMGLPKGVSIDLEEGSKEASNRVQLIQMVKRDIPDITPPEIDLYFQLRHNGDSHSEAVETIGGERQGHQGGMIRSRSQFLQETFTRHLKLMNESINEVNYTTDTTGKPVIAVGAPGSKIRKAIETGDGCCDDCKNGRPCKCDEKPPEEVKEVYAAPFERMRGLANLGERRVSKNGLWENTLKPGESTPQKWHMDTQRAGMVPDKMLNSIQEKLSKKEDMSDKEKRILGKINEVLKKRLGK